MALSRRSLPSVDGGSSGPGPDREFIKAYPLLWEQLSEVAYEDGSARKPASLSVFFDQGSLKGALNDRDASLVAFVTGGSVEALLDAFELGLSEDRLEWRQSFLSPQKRKTKRS